MTTRELWSDGRGWILLTVAAGWALSIGVRFVYPALAPYFRSEFQLDLATTGVLLTLLWGAYAVGHVPGGILGDRVGEGTILVFSTVLSAGAILAVAASVNVWLLFAGTIVFGVATALYGPTRLTIFTNIYSDRAGSAIGLTMAAGNIGNTVFPVTATFLATYATWRLGFGVFASLFAVVTLGLWAAVPSRTTGQTSTVDELSTDTFRQIASGITHESIPMVVAVQTSVSFMIQGFSSFYPVYLSSVKGLSPEVAATLFSLFFAVGAIIQSLTGGLLDRLGMRWTLIGCLAGSALALWLLPFVGGLVPLAAITILFGSWNGCGVVTQTYIADALPEEMQGTGLGTLKAGWMVLGATAPLLMGILANHNYFDEAFLLLAIVGSIGLALAALRL